MLGKKTSNRGRNPLVWLAPDMTVTIYRGSKGDSSSWLLAKLLAISSNASGNGRTAGSSRSAEVRGQAGAWRCCLLLNAEFCRTGGAALRVVATGDSILNTAAPQSHRRRCCDDTNLSHGIQNLPNPTTFVPNSRLERPRERWIISKAAKGVKTTENPNA